MLKLPKIEFERCDGGDNGKKCKNTIQKAYEKFFNIEIEEIEKCCNLEREKLINEFKNKNQDDKMTEFNIDATYKEGIEELTPLFQLSTPIEIKIAIKKGKKSIKNPTAPADSCSINKELTGYAISIFLDVLVFSNDTIKSKYLELSLEDVAYHEFFHTCGENPERGRHDGTLRINEIGIKCIKKLIKENF